MTDVRSIYVTAATTADAERLAEELVDRRLIACANVFPPMTSTYRWKGRVERESEVAMVLKTTEDRVDDVLSAIETLHPYEVPCAVAWPVDAGIPAYLAWVHEATRPTRTT